MLTRFRTLVTIGLLSGALLFGSLSGGCGSDDKGTGGAGGGGAGTSGAAGSGGGSGGTGGGTAGTAG
jgi:hypothetical protein